MRCTAVLAGVLAASIARAAPSDVIPRNADDIPLLDATAATAEDQLAAERLLAAPHRRFRARVAYRMAMATAPETVAWLVAAEDPGGAWEALEPTNRRWLQLLAGLSPEEREAVLSGAREHDVGTSLEGDDLLTLFPHDRLASTGTLTLRRDRSWLPLPVRVLRTRYVGDDGRTVEGSMFAVPPGLIRVLMGGRILAWHGAGPRYASMRTSATCGTRVHLSAAISRDRADHLAAAICAQAENIDVWIGRRPGEAAPSDVFVYSGDERWDIGLPPWDYALPRRAQAHQGESSTRGHELAHVLLFQAWGPQGSAVAGEGMATLLNGDYDAVARARSSLPPDISFRELADDFRYDTLGYYGGAVMAAFVHDRFGADGARRLYQSSDAVGAVAELCDVPEDEAERLMRDWLWGTSLPAE